MAPKAQKRLQRVAAALQSTTEESMINDLLELLKKKPSIIGQVLQSIRNGTYDEVVIVQARQSIFY